MSQPKQTFRNWAGDPHHNPDALRSYPATLAALLAAGGALRYREGVLWPNPGVTPQRASTVWAAFADALRYLDLETFEAIVQGEKARDGTTERGCLRAANGS